MPSSHLYETHPPEGAEPESCSRSGQLPAVTLYTQSACVQCHATRKALERQGIPYGIVDLTDDPEARKYVVELGYSQVPVVIAGNEHWSGFRPDRIKALSAPDHIPQTITDDDAARAAAFTATRNMEGTVTPSSAPPPLPSRPGRERGGQER